LGNRGADRVPRFSFPQCDTNPEGVAFIRRGSAIESTLTNPRRMEATPVIILGIVCLILAAILDAGILWAIGVILVVLGVIFWILGAMGRAVGGRRHYY
jgi:Family of unknown function (DUF6131)